MDNKEQKSKEYADWLHNEVEEFYGRKCERKDMYYRSGEIMAAYETGWDEALKSQWININDSLPNTGVKVLVLTSKGKILVTFRYIPKDIYGNVLGEAEWQGSSALGKSIIAWMPIPSFDKILEDNKDVLKRLKDK